MIGAFLAVIFLIVAGIFAGPIGVLLAMILLSLWLK